MFWEILSIMLLILALTVLILAAAALLFLRFCPSVGKTPSASEQRKLAGRSRQYSEGAFHNENDVKTMTGAQSFSGERKRPEATLPAETPALLPQPGLDDLTFTWLGHSSFLLQMGQKTVLVDAILSERSSPVGFVGPKRFSRLPLRAEELPDMDAVCISHDHYDHLDYRTILAIKDRAGAFIVPLGVDVILRGWGVAPEKIHALNWWEWFELDGLRVTLTPSQHFSGRNPLQRNATLWGGLYLFDGRHRVYYTGDGGYNDVFAQVRERLGEPDLMIGECGQYDPAWANIHMFPEQTVQAALDVGASWLVPVHWGSFCICNHPWDDSIRRVTEAANAAGLPLATPPMGKTVRYAAISAERRAWWDDPPGSSTSYVR